MRVKKQQNKDKAVEAALVDTIVSRNLKARRISLALSQKEIAEALGVSIQQIQKYENAVNRISSGKLYGIAKLLRIPIAELFTNPRNKQLGI
jgi:transcriptional regulator with XRE-family HTH domain